MENYFNKFPSMIYNDKECVDITKRVSFGKNQFRKTNMFYTYDIQNNFRADQVAEYYYRDPTYDWLIMLQNGIIDPYYGWHLSEQDFDSFIIEKYGSYETSIKKIKYYQLNWVDGDEEITTSFYENNLPYEHRKYYVPVYGVNTKITSYERRKEDWIINTNKIIKLNVNNYTNGNSFTVGELVDIKSNLNNQTANGTGEVLASNSSAVIIKNINGYTTNNYYVVGETSNTSAIFSSANTMIENISNSEFIFWTSITCFEYEKQKNERNKSIRLIDANYSLQLAEDLRVKLLE
jgi:Ca2+-binding RTX toxin-like protein